MKIIKVLILCIIMITGVACSSAGANSELSSTATPSPNESNEGGALEAAPEELIDQIEPVEEEENMAEDLESALEALELDASFSAEEAKMVTKSIAHVVEFTEETVAPQDVQVVSVEQTQWSDGSLGCPIEGMMYTQAIVPGYVIELDVNGNIYEVHTDTNNQTALCIVNGEKITP